MPDEHTMRRIRMTDLRAMTNGDLRLLKEPAEIFSYSQPIAVLVPYELFLKWQDLIVKGEKHVTSSIRKTGPEIR